MQTDYSRDSLFTHILIESYLVLTNWFVVTLRLDSYFLVSYSEDFKLICIFTISRYFRCQIIKIFILLKHFNKMIDRKI